jgi:hypothetical protein
MRAIMPECKKILVIFQLSLMKDQPKQAILIVPA